MQRERVAGGKRDEGEQGRAKDGERGEGEVRDVSDTRGRGERDETSSRGRREGDR